MDDLFSAALRAELDAIVARYQALARAHHEALAGALRDRAEAATRQAEVLTVERDALRARDADARGRLAQLSARIEALEADAERGLGRLEADLARARQGFDEELARERERLGAEGERERERAARAEERAEALARELAQARQEGERLARDVERARAAVGALEAAFAAERAFVEAALAVRDAPLFAALAAALGRPLEPAPAAYAALKECRPDAVLASALNERGRALAHAPLSAAERVALTRLAEAAGSELIDPVPGARFSAQTMEKAGTEPDPAEEGNVTRCALPGLRLRGTDGALVFPRVVVATG
jgi:predicted  nucleic acid-binding Zn-ribbon protein